MIKVDIASPRPDHPRKCSTGADLVSNPQGGSDDKFDAAACFDELFHFTIWTDEHRILRITEHHAPKLEDDHVLTLMRQTLQLHVLDIVAPEHAKMLLRHIDECQRKCYLELDRTLSLPGFLRPSIEAAAAQ
ncbi:hypothetical protein SDRG_14454 [Saprolegnia diclina VS20]|uniref:Uncharacterized protein n=1 Tax=Saprolegnia diclina (strain VS20) TaxID=1156394 RepID=T0Q2R9_SAPDV|nr:hypothetical protein SDRG_14454 [Saprolegnia diclina VS20]EQC27700.1 hypothetical protein SDRG_14454 [Saprolegnia diclina VS20]|eukprot:XP_008618805.1 hypothetical protein SDRG_14454 [Saprolegnia diclina VS20]